MQYTIYQLGNSMKLLAFFISIFLFCSVGAEELKIRADYFESDQKKGISLFRGNVHIRKSYDEINASKVTIYIDKQRNPIKFIAEGNVFFKIEDKHKKRYIGKAQKAVYEPKKEEYRFYNDVYLRQIGDKKEIQGDEVVFNVTNGKAHAKGVKNNPVVMIFDIKEKQEDQK